MGILGHNALPHFKSCSHLPISIRFIASLCAKSLQSCPSLCNPADCSSQAPLSMGFSRQEYWSELPCPPPGDLPNPGIKPVSLVSPELAGRFFATGTTWEAQSYSKSSLESSIMPHHGITQPEYILVILILKLVYVSSLRVGSTSPCPSLTSVWIPNTIPSLASGRHV